MYAKYSPLESARNKLIILIRREDEVAINVATMKSQIEQTLAMKVRRRTKDTRIHRHPVHGLGPPNHYPKSTQPCRKDTVEPRFEAVITQRDRHTPHEVLVGGVVTEEDA